MLSLMSLISYITLTDYFNFKFVSSSSDRVLDYSRREYLERDFVDFFSLSSREWLVVLGVEDDDEPYF